MRLARIALWTVAVFLFAVVLHAQGYQPVNFLYAQGIRVKQALTVDSAAAVTFNNALLTVNALTANGIFTANSTSTMGDTLTFASNKGISVPGTTSSVTIGHSLQVGPPASATTDTGYLQLLRANGTNKVFADFRAKMNAAAGTGDCGAAGSIVVRPGNGSFSAEMYQCAQDQSTIDRFLKVPDLTNTALVSPTITGTVAGGATYSSPNLTTPTIGGGDGITKAFKWSFSVTGGTVNANSCAEADATVSGIAVGDGLAPTSDHTFTLGLTWSNFQSKSGAIHYVVCNPTAANVTDGATVTFSGWAFR